jgi:hypothetical protein
VRILALAILFTSRLLACSCAPISACEMVDQPIIFIGKVIDGGVSSLTDDPWNSKATHARFKVLEGFRGIPAGTDTVDVQLHFTPGMCSPVPYHLGQSYLVVPFRLGETLNDGGCSSSRNIEESVDDVRFVRQYFSGKMTANIHGLVGSGSDSYSLSVYAELIMGLAKRLQGVQVIATLGRSAFTATTDAEGKYFLPLPQGGTYQVHAALGSLQSKEQEVGVPARGCRVQNFALPTDNAISGRVWDWHGQPMKGAIIGLIDIDHPNDKMIDHAWFARAESGADGTYRLVMVPAGRYLLVSNPDGPYGGSGYSLPFETTYYPLGSNRRAAKIVEIGHSRVKLTGMDLIIGQRIEARPVTVKVKFPDGKPMTTARAECTGEPIEPGGLVWKKMVRDGEPIQVPVNRRLRIEVIDFYGRDLKATYASTHEPGSAAIVENFVVKP